MARIRTIKPEFWTHEDLSALPEATHMLAAALLNHADDEGYFNAHPGLVRAACSPLREPSVSIQDSLNLLVGIRFIELGKGSDGKRYGRVITFDSHQRVNRPTPSKIKELQIVWESSPKAHAQLSEDSPPERKGTGNGEGKGKEQGKDLFVPDGTLPDEPKSKISKHPGMDRLTQVVLSAYHETLPNCARVEVLNPKRLKRVQAADRLARQVCGQQEWPYAPDDFWRSYFGECLDDPWLRGDVPNPKNPRWKQNLGVLIDEDRFAEIMDRAITRLKTTEAAA